MATPPLRHDLQQLLDELDAVDRAVDILVAPLSDAQFFWQPNEGRSWSIAQCLEHLATANTLYGEAMAHGLEAARARGRTGGGPIASSVFGRLFISSMEPPVRRRFRAPGKIVPRTTRTREEILRAFREGRIVRIKAVPPVGFTEDPEGPLSARGSPTARISRVAGPDHARSTRSIPRQIGLDEGGEATGRDTSAVARSEGRVARRAQLTGEIIEVPRRVYSRGFIMQVWRRVSSCFFWSFSWRCSIQQIAACGRTGVLYRRDP